MREKKIIRTIRITQGEETELLKAYEKYGEMTGRTMPEFIRCLLLIALNECDGINQYDDFEHTFHTALKARQRRKQGLPQLPPIGSRAAADYTAKPQGKPWYMAIIEKYIDHDHSSL
jgi:hypothetical protein